MQPTWQALIDGARYCEPHLREIIARQRPDVIVEDNVVSFPALQTAGAPFVRIVSCNPLEIRGDDPDAARRSRRPTPACPRTTRPAGRRSARSTTGPTARRGRRSTPGAGRTGPRRCPSSSSRTPRASSTSTSTRRSPTTSIAGRSAATWLRLDSTVRSTDAPFELPAALADRPAGSALVYLSLGSLGSRRPRADAAARGGPGRHAPPLHRLEGPAARRLRPRAEHVGRGVPAADLDRSARRPRDHPRRQQHDDRGVPLRQADDRAAAVLGPVRQRPAGRRDRLRRPAADVRVRGRRPGAARSTACSAT